MMHLSLRRAALAVALSLVAGCSSSGNADDGSDGGDASVEINTLINAVCTRNLACEPVIGATVTDCVVSLETDLVGDPYDCPVSQEETCLKEAAALPCVDAGGAAEGTAVAACLPCIPPMLPLPDASPSHPVDACSLFNCDAD